MILLGCCGTINEYQAILDMGYDYVELSGRQIMELSDRQFESFINSYRPGRLPCRGFNDYCSGAYPIVGPGCGGASGIEYAQKLLLRGHALGIKTIGIGAPAARRLPEGYKRSLADWEMARFLKTTCQIAAEYHITILLEAVHRHMCSYLNYTREAVSLVSSLRISNLAIVLDYYHAMVMGENLQELQYAMPYVRHLHISTDLDAHKRGYIHAQDVPLLSGLLKDAIAWGYSGGISVEADLAKLTLEGAQCRNWMHQALLAAEAQSAPSSGGPGEGACDSVQR